MATITQFPLPFPHEIFELELTQGFKTTIDKVDADLIQHRWCVTGSGDVPYAVRYVPKPDSKQKTSRFLHREILERVLSRPLLANEQVDHIDGHPLNNCRSNLRLATQTQNRRNSRKHRNNTSGYKGVSWHTTNKKWRAQIRVDGRLKFLGHFDDVLEAYKAYCEAAQKYHGEFARLA